MKGFGGPFVPTHAVNNGGQMFRCSVSRAVVPGNVPFIHNSVFALNVYSTRMTFVSSYLNAVVY